MDADFRFAELQPPCAYCRHLTEIGYQDLTGWVCKAFPEGIPRAILRRAADHDDPDEQIGGEMVVFESKVYLCDDGPNKVTFYGEWYVCEAPTPEESAEAEKM